VQDVAASFGKRLRTIRRTRSLTQETLAERAGLAPSYISKLERARGTAISFSAVGALAAALKIPVAEFFADRRPEPRELLPMSKLQELLRGRRAGEIELVYRVAERICNFEQEKTR